MMKHYFLLLITLCSIQPARSSGQKLANRLRYPDLVIRFYDLKGNIEFDSSVKLSYDRLVDSCPYFGLEKSRHNPKSWRKEISVANTDAAYYKELLFLDDLITFLKDLSDGATGKGTVSYDGVSSTNKAQRDSLLLHRLAAVRTDKDLLDLVNHLESQLPGNQALKTELREQLNLNNPEKTKQLKQALNVRRWIFHSGFEHYIVVNIASATLNYYHSDSLLLNMRIVAGKPSTKTPRFAAFCDQIIFYPYWNVPRSIAVNEILPACRETPAILDMLNLEVINNKGDIVSPNSIDWKNMSKRNFPYKFRQSTGCDNALGVIKFNLNSPYSVYLHDTNMKSVFSASSRYYSHGCVRIEKPIELATYLLPDIVNSEFLKACIKGQRPVPYNLPEKVPVFVIYTTVDLDTNGNVQYYPDTYNLN